MKDDISILIADDNFEFANLVNDYMSREADIRVVGIARDGLQAIEMIKLLTPDIVILDIIMPNLDGIGVLERISDMRLTKKPLFLILSAIGQDIFIQQAILLGAEYYVLKPFDIDILVSRVRQIYKENRMPKFTQNKMVPKTTLESGALECLHNLEVEVTNLIRDVGIPPHMAGYQYIRAAIMQTVNTSKVFTSITKVLYPSVASKFKSTPQKVERAIRNAIETAWARGNLDAVNSLFGYTVNYSKGKPTNSEFIAMAADKVRINMGLDIKNS